MEYNKKVVCDYIMGNDISYDIEALEDNPKFMLEVIKESQDKRMYNLCSERVKGNYDLVKYLITNFSDDLNFCDTVFDNYIKNKENDDNDIEFVLIMYNNVCSTDNNELIMKYGICKESVYIMEMATAEAVKSSSSKKEFSEEIGLGYFLLQDHYGFNNIILDFFSRRMLDDIFYRNPKLNFEEIIHNNFRNKEALEKFGINRFIISYVQTFDKYLADHLAINIDLVKDVNKDIKRVINRWDSYMERINKVRYDILLQYVAQFYSQHQSSIMFDVYGILCQELKRLGFEYIMNQEDLDEHSLIHTLKKNTILEIKFKNNIRHLISELFKTDVIDKTVKESDIDDKNKVLDLKYSLGRDNIVINNN